jgi:hypothetical protein
MFMQGQTATDRKYIIFQQHTAKSVSVDSDELCMQQNDIVTQGEGNDYST